MTDNFNYKEVPGNYAHCLNEQCPRAYECLRFQVAQYANANKTSFLVINPKHIASQKECSHFRPVQLVRHAVGITHLFDNLPYSKTNQIKRQIQRYFERNHYYRIYRKERYINPEGQDFIRELFRKEGILEEPVFDEYIDTYVWG